MVGREDGLPYAPLNYLGLAVVHHDLQESWCDLQESWCDLEREICSII